MSPKAIEIIIRQIIKKMKELDANPPIELTSLIPDFHIYFDKTGKYLKTEIPNYLEYKYERMRILARRAFSGNADLPNLLKIIDIYHNQHIEAIKLDTIGNQSPEERCGEIANISIAISEAVGGGNIDTSTENFRYKMISALSVTNNMDKKTWIKISKNIKPVEEIAIQTLCANCNKIANSQCECGTKYCSRNCKDAHWKNGHKNTCSVFKTSTMGITIHKCAQCNTTASNKCICKLVYYCNTSCQKLHRKEHKSICKQRCCEIQLAIDEEARLARELLANEQFAESKLAKELLAREQFAESELAKELFL
jgi:hypothetical protein